MGYMSIPVFTVDSPAAGTSPVNRNDQLGWISRSYILHGPFNAVNNASMTTLVPTLGFSLVGNVTSTASVTVTDMNQFAVG